MISSKRLCNFAPGSNTPTRLPADERSGARLGQQVQDRFAVLPRSDVTQPQHRFVASAFPLVPELSDLPTTQTDGTKRCFAQAPAANRSTCRGVSNGPVRGSERLAARCRSCAQATRRAGRFAAAPRRTKTEWSPFRWPAIRARRCTIELRSRFVPTPPAPVLRQCDRADPITPATDRITPGDDDPKQQTAHQPDGHQQRRERQNALRGRSISRAFRGPAAMTAPTRARSSARPDVARLECHSRSLLAGARRPSDRR